VYACAYLVRKHNDKSTPRSHVTSSEHQACPDPGFFSVLFHSEDYYGDLDLKSIRKSELLAGIQSEPRKPSSQALKPRPSTVGGPARPSGALQE